MKDGKLLYIEGFEPMPKEFSEIETLIVGTHPSPNGLAKGVYYSSSDNRLWSTLDSIYNNGILTLIGKLQPNMNNDAVIKEIEKKLIEMRVGFYDVIESCEGGGTDKQIKNPKLRSVEDFEKLFINSKINKVVFTGHGVEKYFNKIIADGRWGKDKLTDKYFDNFEVKEGRRIERVVAPSPSPCAEMVKITRDVLEKEYRKILLAKKD